MPEDNFIINCPIEIALDHIGKKWTIEILRDMTAKGKRRFHEFLDENPKLTSKVLSERLKKLEKDGIVNKMIVSMTPLRAEYILTPLGESLNKIQYELSMFSVNAFPERVLANPNIPREELITTFGRMYKLPEAEIQTHIDLDSKFFIHPLSIDLS